MWWKDLSSFFSTSDIVLATGGASGGVVRWIYLQEKPIRGLLGIIVGAICAVYLSQLALPIVELVLGKILIEPTKQLTFSGFVVGLGGTQVPGFIIDLWKGVSERAYPSKTSVKDRQETTNEKLSNN